MDESELIFTPLDHKVLAQTITCRLCGQPSHLLPLKPHIVFWVHQGSELEKCSYIAYKTSFSNYLRQALEDKSKHLAKQIIEGEKSASNTADKAK